MYTPLTEDEKDQFANLGDHQALVRTTIGDTPVAVVADIWQEMDGSFGMAPVALLLTWDLIDQLHIQPPDGAFERSSDLNC